MTYLDSAWYVVADGARARVLKHAGGTFHPLTSLTAGDEGEDAFARTLATYLNDAAERGEIDGLALAAPPRTLHLLRTHLSATVRALVVSEQPHDLTGVADHDLPSHFDIPATGWLRPVPG
ncbi:host attachment protein [Gluconacetobacter azotocaptans]|uniref:Host attachment protein n=1 Tax=Gluconacetobacter azotocaptans TaxID=142834 RepID=A0A7W4JV72_9PROT|nr:host attachment protein [Gluconacetobacter azotocaptans]MBB2191405.1 host attachment protein [Gluconacetobacter azotocaptans]